MHTSKILTSLKCIFQTSLCITIHTESHVSVAAETWHHPHFVSILTKDANSFQTVFIRHTCDTYSGHTITHFPAHGTGRLTDTPCNLKGNRRWEPVAAREPWLGRKSGKALSLEGKQNLRSRPQHPYTDRNRLNHRKSRQRVTLQAKSKDPERKRNVKLYSLEWSNGYF